MRAFQADVDHDGVLWVTGMLSSAAGPTFIAAAEVALVPGRELVIDASELELMDSEGVRALITVAQRAERGVVLRHPRRIVEEVIAITGIARAGIRLEP